MSQQNKNNAERPQQHPALEYLTNINSTYRKVGVLVRSVVIGCVLISLAAVLGAYHYGSARTNQVYILDDNTVLSAISAERGYELEPEIVDHVNRFHDLFYNIAPLQETIDVNEGRAMALVDTDVQNYMDDQKESGFYSNIIRLGVVQQIEPDSVKVNMDVLPYEATYYGKLYFKRATMLYVYSLISTCKVVDIGQRTTANPHGLLMQDYRIKQRNMIDQREINNN